MNNKKLEARRAQVLSDLARREAALKAELFELQSEIGAARKQADALELVRLTGVVPLGEDPAAADPETPIDPAPADDRSDEEGPNDDEASSDSPRGWFLGAGLGTRINLSGKRVKEVAIAELSNNDVIAQVSKSDQTEIRILFESHYMFENPSIADAGLFGPIEAFASCGLWSFIKPGSADSEKRGCGPFVAVAFDEDASPEEFAIGHMVSFKRNDESRPFNFGYGLIIDPDSKTLDSRLLEEDSMVIRDEFVANVLDGTLSLTTEEETIGALLMFSTNF